MKIFIVRHALAMEKDEFAQTGRSDDERPLIDKGRDQMKKVAKSLRKRVGQLDMIVTSPLVRATQTSDILVKYWDQRECQVIEALKPESSYSQFFEWLKELPPESKSIAIVGHEPHLGGLTSWLLTGQEKSFIAYKKSGVALVELTGEALVVGQAQLAWLLTPKFAKS